MVSVSSIKTPFFATTHEDNLTERKKESLALLTRCSCPHSQEDTSFLLLLDREGKIATASSPSLSPQEEDNGKLSWLRRSDSLQDQAKPLGRRESTSTQQERIFVDDLDASQSPSRRGRSTAEEEGNRNSNGSSVPESDSEISAPLRHDQTHVFPVPLGPLEEFAGNDDGVDVNSQDNEQVVEEEEVGGNSNCEKCSCATMKESSQTMMGSSSPPLMLDPSSCQSQDAPCPTGNNDGSIYSPNENELECFAMSSKHTAEESDESDCLCFPFCEECGNNNCGTGFSSKIGESGGGCERFRRNRFSRDSRKGESWDGRGSGGGGGRCGIDIDSSFTLEFKNRCDEEGVDIDEGVNYTCAVVVVADDGETGEMRTVKMIRKLGEKGSSGGGGRGWPFMQQRYLWLSYAFLLFLSVLSSAHGLSLDDDDDDEFGGVSPYEVLSRSRRSAESFSILNDALSLIPSNYSIHEPPPTNNSEATQVDFSVLIMNVRDIKELNEGYGDLELSLEMNLRIYWKDTRLSHLADRSGNKFIVLNPVLLDKIWHPDIFIDHVKGVAQPALISKPASLRIYPDSSVRYSARITVTMACQMDFHYYPADTQRCDVDMKSYAYSSKILALDWREGKGALLVEYLELPNFDVALDTTQNFMVNTSSGSYSGIRFTILLRRKLSYHLIQTYLPSTLFIIVSWLSFLVPPESVPGRMALCMTTLLTLTAMFSAVRQNTPNVSYVKALDIWMVVCIIFVFLTLVEYTVLLKLKSKKPKPKPPNSQTEVVLSAQPQTQTLPQQTVTRWTIPSLQYSADDAPNFKFRGCKSVEVVINENGNAEMRHRENGNHGEPNDAGGDAGNNIPRPITAHPTPPPPPPPPQPMNPADRPLNKYELAAKKIEKFTSAVIPTLFVIFNFIYWPWLIESADYYNHDKTTTIFKSM